MDEKKITRIPKGMLRRKFVAPSLPAYHVAETAMTEQIDRLDEWRVCLIHSKGGTGKTTLLSQWYNFFSKRNDCVPLWVSLEPRDTQGDSFARVLATLLQQIDERFVSLLQGFEGESDSYSMLVDLVNLIDEASESGKTYLLIMDDYDSASSPDLDSALVFLNRNLALNWRIIVAGSFLSSSLDDLLLDSSVLEFRSYDLTFNGARLRELADTLLPWMGEEGRAEMFQIARGWPLAFVFASLAHKRARNESEVHQITTSYLGRYFAKEVLGRLNEKTRSFMVLASLLDTMPPELCDIIAGTDCAQEILDELTVHNCFIQKEENGEYVFDPLFLNKLRDDLMLLKHEQIVRMAKLASAWYEKQGRVREEAKYLALACEPIFVEDMAFYSTSVSYPSQYGSITEYLLKQPANTWSSNQYLTWVAIWAYISSGMVERARNAMAQAHRIDGEVTQHAYQYADALCMALEGKSQESYDAVRELLELDSQEIPKEFRCLFLHMEGEDCERLGRIRESRDLYMRALSLAEQMNGSFYKLFDMYLLSRHYIYFDDFDRAIDFAERIIAAADKETPIWSAAHAVIAYIHTERGDLAKALDYFEDMDMDSLSMSNIDMHIDVTVARARYLWVSGDTIGALAMMQDLLAELVGANVSIPRNVQYDAYSSLALMAAQAGDLVALHPCVEKLKDGAALPDLARAIPCMTSLAAYYWVSGDSEVAHSLMNEVRERIDASECAGAYWMAKTYVVESAYFAEEGQRAAGASMLSRAISLAMRNGYLSVFLLGGMHVKTMLLEMITNRKTPSAIKTYARQVLTLFGDDAEIDEDLAIRKGDVQGYYSLTEREREILHLLNSGMSRQELSEHLVISQNTAKTHLKNIYAKLGVHTRAEAYRITREHEEF